MQLNWFCVISVAQCFVLPAPFHVFSARYFQQVWIVVQLSEDPDSSDEVRVLGGIPLLLSLIQ